MGGNMLFQVFVPLLLVATASSSENVFGLTGGSIVLQAEQVTSVSSIIWKHNKDKAAEWFKDDDAPTYYNIFANVTKLNMQTWALTISNLKPNFNGKYSAEVNNKDPTQFVNLTVLGPVSKPEITMDCIDINCTLTCKGKEDGFTTYTWAKDIHELPQSKLTVEKLDRDVVYTCKFSNPVSSASSQGTVKKYVPPPPDSGSGTAIAVVLSLLMVLFVFGIIIVLLWRVLKKKDRRWADLCTSQDKMDLWRSCISCNNGAGENPTPLSGIDKTGAGENPANNQTPLLGNGETEHKELEGGEENPGDEGKQQLPNTVTPPVPSGEDKSPELDHRLPSVTERKEPDGNEDSPGMPNPEDKRQPETDPDPAPEEKLPANAPGSTAEEEHKEPEGGEKSSEKTNTEDKRQPETDTDPLLEGKLPANAPGSTAEEENNEAHGGKESPEKTNTEDEKLPKADTDQLHEEKLGEPVETSTADGENNEAHGGKESPEKTNTEVIKQTEANTDQLHEGELTGNGAGPTADGENNEAHGGKESPEKTNTDPTSEVSKL